MKRWDLEVVECGGEADLSHLANHSEINKCDKLIDIKKYVDFCCIILRDFIIIIWFKCTSVDLSTTRLEFRKQNKNIKSHITRIDILINIIKLEGMPRWHIKCSFNYSIGLDTDADEVQVRFDV